MPSLIQQAKAGFQFVKTIVPEIWAQSRHTYQEDKVLQLVRANLGSRLSQNSGRINFIMALPIVNWETTLIEHARAHGECHHIGFESRGFFESKVEWNQYRAANLAKLKSSFEKAYSENDINILFLYLSEFYIDPEGLAAFKLKNVIIVHFNWDDRLHYNSRHKGQSVGVRGMAKLADLNLTMAVGSMSRYVADGAAVFYWRGSQNSLIKAPQLPELEFNRVLFFGSKYGFREELIEYLVRKGLPIDVYGSGWGTEFLPYDVLEYKIPRYALNLGVSTLGYTQRLSSVKGRDIEVPSAGGLYLTKHSQEILQVYTPGKDILTYRTMDDCYRQACEVLQDPSVFDKVRRSGAIRAQCFSWEARFLYLTELIRGILSSETKS
jgi:hypothetical protein